MNLLELLHAGDWLGQTELVDLFRLGHRESDARDRHETIRILDDRFNLAEKRHISTGVLLDGVNWLSTRSYDERFEYVMDLMRAASRLEAGPLWPDRDVADSIADLCGGRLPVQFSFKQALPSCLIYAKRIKESADGVLDRYPLDAVRYAGLGAEVPMLAYAALYLQLPIRVQPGRPWEGDEAVDGNGDPYDNPRLAIAMPSQTHRAGGDLDLIQSAKNIGLPRMVDRDKIDVESATLSHHGSSEHPSLVFVSEEALSAARQSKKAVRIALRRNQVVKRIAEITRPLCREIARPVFIVELGGVDVTSKTITMEKVDSLEKAGIFDKSRRELQRKVQQVEILDIQSSGDNFLPSRYLARSVRKTMNFSDAFNLMRSPEKVRVADLFEVIRPKVIRNEVSAEREIGEIGVHDISILGKVSMPPSRKLRVRETLLPNIEAQRARPRDILFVHRTNIGRMAYVDPERPFLANRDLLTDDYERRQEMPWVSQGITILRPRYRKAGDEDQRRCDPRLLYMFMIAHGIGSSWREKASGRSSPAIPVGEIECLAIPTELVEGQVDTDGRDYTKDRPRIREALLRSFDERRKNIEEIVRIEAYMLMRLTDVHKQFYIRNEVLGLNSG